MINDNKDLRINVNPRRFGHGWVKETMAIKDQFQVGQKSLHSVRNL